MPAARIALIAAPSPRRIASCARTTGAIANPAASAARSKAFGDCHSPRWRLITQLVARCKVHPRLTADSIHCAIAAFADIIGLS
jgi:hypothetical protein